MVRVLVGQQHGRSAGEGGRVGEHARVDHEPALLLAEDDARVAVLDQLHGSTSMTASCPRGGDGACRSRNPCSTPIGEGIRPGP
jgi:hypothetical protein